MEKTNKMDKFLEKIPRKFIYIAGFLGLFLLATGSSWIIFSSLDKETDSALVTSNIGGSRSKIAPGSPKTEECPINGEKFTKEEKSIWEGRRPIAVVIENHADSRPASGLSRADVVYEAVSEGGITRFLAVYYCGAAAEDVKVAPVRSARIYYINWASEYGEKPIFMHIGGANDYSGTGTTAKDARALEFLEKIGWRIAKGNDFDTTYDSGFPVFWRNYERLGRTVATEHTMMASLDAAYEAAQKRGFTSEDKSGKKWDGSFVKWRFTDDVQSSGVKAEKISFGFWENAPDYEVEWRYDPQSKKYLRFNGGKEHLDHETKSQLSASSVVILFVSEKGPVDANKHMLYTTTGSGKALVFQAGTVTETTWKKDSGPPGRTKFMDKSGKEISFVRGPIWFEAVPLGNQVSY